MKRVAFQEKLVEILPSPVIYDTSDSENDLKATEEEHRRRRKTIEAEDGHATPVQGRPKRQREWVWRPLEDDVLTAHETDSSMNHITTPLSAKSPAISVVAKDDFGIGNALL